MIYHIVNGDSLASNFPLYVPNDEGKILVMREAMIDGPFESHGYEHFWEIRAKALNISMDAYFKGIFSQLKVIINANSGSEFNLWFEHDLFCQTNLWFLLSLIQSFNNHVSVYNVYPLKAREDKNFWNGFTLATADELRKAFEQRIKLTDEDVSLGAELWHIYRENDLSKLFKLAEKGSPAFPYLSEVVKAHADRFPPGGGMGRPEKVIKELIDNGAPTFETVLLEFWDTQSIYGFGDTQLRRMYNRING